MPEHFPGTTEAIDALTQSYRGVFEPREQGANRRVGETRFRGALKDRAASEQGVTAVAVIDETLPEKTRDAATLAFALTRPSPDA